MLGKEIEIVCSRRCGFRVHERYYYEKRDRFAPGLCARCSSPLQYVERGTDVEVLGVEMVLEGDSRGRLIRKEV